MKRRTLVVAGAVAVAVLAGAYALSRAEADGVPTIDPLVYAGTLLESGAPDTAASRNIGITLWTDEVETGGSFLACTTPSRPTPLVGGRFRMALDPSCADAVGRHTDLWVQVEVDGAPLARTHLGAVPYALEAGNGVPPGTIVPFAGDVLPVGWLECDGRALRSADYPRLFAAIRTAWGNGSSGLDADPPMTDFNLPDLRGRFLRGVDEGAGVDPDGTMRTAAAPGGNEGDRVGSVQPDQFRSHDHGWAHYRPGAGHNLEFNISYIMGGGNFEAGDTSRGGNETRPVNAAVRFIIRR